MPDHEWKRPKSVPFPKVWRRFDGKKPLHNGKIPKFRIQDVTEDLEDAVVDHILTGFLRDSPLTTLMKIWEDPKSMSDCAALYRESIKQQISLVALLDDIEDNSKPVIVGAHILTVQPKEEKDFDFSERMAHVCWKRPASIFFPKIWRRFEGKTPLANGKTPKFCIQDVTDDLEDEVVEHMMTSFLKDSLIHRSMKSWKDAECVSKTEAIFRDALKQNISLVALTDDNCNTKTIVAGVYLLTVEQKNSAKNILECHGERWKRLSTAMQYPYDLLDVYEKYGVHEILMGRGMSVAQKFRGQGLSLELVKAKCDLQNAIGVKVAPEIAIGIDSQKLAEEMRFNLLLDIPYENFVIHGEAIFNILSVPSVKYYVCAL